MEQIVTLKAVINKDSHLPKVLLENSVYRLGSQFKNGATYNPLNKKEEGWLCEFFGWDMDHHDTRRKIIDFWKNFTVKIENVGRLLNLTMVDERPVNFIDYITFKFAKGHTRVASTKEQSESNSEYKFYMVNPLEEAEKRNSEIKEITTAMMEFAKVSADAERSKLFYITLGGSRANFTSNEEINSFLFDIANTKPLEFIALSKDKNEEAKAKINLFVEYNILRKVGTSYFHRDEIVADSLDEMLAFMNTKSNSGLISEWSLKLKEFSKISN